MDSNVKKMNASRFLRPTTFAVEYRLPVPLIFRPMEVLVEVGGSLFPIIPNFEIEEHAPRQPFYARLLARQANALQLCHGKFSHKESL